MKNFNHLQQAVASNQLARLNNISVTASFWGENIRCVCLFIEGAKEVLQLKQLLVGKLRLVRPSAPLQEPTRLKLFSKGVYKLTALHSRQRVFAIVQCGVFVNLFRALSLGTSSP